MCKKKTNLVPLGVHTYTVGYGFVRSASKSNEPDSMVYCIKIRRVWQYGTLYIKNITVPCKVQKYFIGYGLFVYIKFNQPILSNTLTKSTMKASSSNSPSIICGFEER